MNDCQTELISLKGKSELEPDAKLNKRDLAIF